LLKLFELENNYALIYGEHGVGKTTSVKYVVKKAREQGIPVLYFPVETQEGVNFVESFAAALKGFDVVPKTAPLEWRDLLKIYLGFTKDAPTSVKSLFPTLVKAGKILTKKTGKRPVLVIDACNNLEKEPGGLSILENLQDFAKEQADKNEILVIFVSSEGKAPQTLLTRSAASRMRRYRIEELDREEADTYLQKVMNIKNKETRAKILDITGYTFNYLNLANYDVKSIEQEVATSIKGNLKAVGLVGWDTDDKIVKVVQEILNHGRITYKEYFNIIGDREKAEKILQGNVFTTKEIGVETVIYFQNTATRNFFARSLKMMETTK
jgi:KaiC/GvpD/RAD55 family RecA-like ATPase